MTIAMVVMAQDRLFNVTRTMGDLFDGAVMTMAMVGRWRRFVGVVRPTGSMGHAEQQQQGGRNEDTTGSHGGRCREMGTWCLAIGAEFVCVYFNGALNKPGMISLGEHQMSHEHCISN